MASGMRAGMRGLGFLATVLANVALSFILMATAIRSFGIGAWSGLAVGQTVGAILAVMVSLGWPVAGPAQVANASRPLRVEIYVDSLSSRIGMYIVVAPFLALAVNLFSPASSWWVPSALMGLATLASALAGQWYFVGVGRPGALLALDVCPRAVCALVAILGSTLGLGEVYFSGILLLGATLTAWGQARHIAESPIRPTLWSKGLRFRSVLQRNRGWLFAQMLATGYTHVPVLVVAAVLPQSVATYAAVDRVHKSILTLSSPLTHVAQSYVPSGGGTPDLAVRIKRVILWSSGLAIVSGIVYVPLQRAAIWVLSDGRIPVPSAITQAFGMMLAIVLVSSVVGHACLTSIGDSRALVLSTGVGALLGLPMLLGAAWFSGLTAMVWVIATTELVVLGVQLAVIVRWLQSGSGI